MGKIGTEKNNTRTYNSIKNMIAGFFGEMLNLLLAFITRTVFIKFLSMEFLGISSLFANILSVLNMAELGIGMAITYALYEPLARLNTDKVKTLMKLYKQAYLIIGTVICIAGIATMPFLKYMMKGTTGDVNEIIIFGLYLLQTASSYWFFAYKVTLLQADQKKYITSVVVYSTSIVGKIMQIIFLYFLKSNPIFSFYIYTAIGVVTIIVSNIIISIIVNKKYPYILEKNVNPLSKEEKKAIIKNVYGLTVYKISSIVNASADNIIISAFIGISKVGVFANYTIIVSAVHKMVNMVFESLTASIGNMKVLESNEKTESFFYVLHLVAFWSYGWSFICLWVLINPFISDIWLGRQYVLPEITVLMITLNYLVDGLMVAPIRYRIACGLHWQSRYRAVLATIVNIVFSLFFVIKMKWGITGVVFATIISRIGVTLWFDPYVISKNVFNKSPKKYYFIYFRDLFIILCTGCLVWVMCIKLPTNSLFFIVRLIICTIVPNLCWFIIFRQKTEFKYLKNVMISLVKQYVQKLRKK